MRFYLSVLSASSSSCRRYAPESRNYGRCARKVTPHVKGTRRVIDRKATLPVRKVAGVLPEKCPIKGSASHLLPSVLHEKMLDLGRHRGQIEDPVGRFHPLQVDRDHPEAAAEEEYW